MPATILYTDRPPHRADVAPEGEDLWLTAAELAAATGWELRPEGLCRGEVCVPVPPGGRDRLVSESPRRVNLAGLARRLGQPVVHDDALGVWAFGESWRARREALASLQAPDFTLPDLDGRPHTLSDYRGHKVFLVSWASW
jgi:hypothetical protein